MTGMIADEHSWKRRIPGFGLSLVVHLLILGVLGMITWFVATSPPDEHVLILTDEDVAVREANEADTGDPGSQAGEVSGRPEAATSREPAALLPPVPPAKSPDASVIELPEEPATLTLRTPKLDGADSLAKNLAGVTRLNGAGFGTGPLPGFSPGFGKEIGNLRKKGLDVVLVLDATNSMSPYIEQGKRRLREILDIVTHLVPKARFGVVAYKDYGDDYGLNAVKGMKITRDTDAIRKFINGIVAGGGGDIPEPINEAIKVATDFKVMGWKGGAKRLIILVGDSPIHPSGRKTAFRDARNFALKLNGTINVIDVGGAGTQGARRQTVLPDLAEIAKKGGGQAFLLQEQEEFWRHLIVSVFGRKYEKDVTTIIEVLIDGRP